MNPRQRRNIILLLVLAAVGGFLIWYQVFRETPQQRAYREQYEATKTGQPASASTPAKAASPAVATAAAPAAAPSKFQHADVDIDQLIAGIKEVGFDYDAVALNVNPMTPLVGPFAPKRVAAANGAEGIAGPTRQDIQMLVRNIHVTGIMWDKYDPMAVVTFPVQNDKTTEVVTRGFAFPEEGVTVHDIEKDRIILNINGVLVPIELEER